VREERKERDCVVYEFGVFVRDRERVKRV